MKILFSMKLIGKLLRILLLLFLILTAMALGYYFAVTRDIALCPEKLQLHENNITVYDMYDQEITNVSGSSFKETITFDRIPELTRNAFISIEDKTFFQHHGFNVKRILKAAYSNIKTNSFKEGASTISQQLIKNTH